MKALTRQSLGLLCCIAAVGILIGASKRTAIPATVPKDPFIANNGLVPPPSQYNGPLFKLNHAWPAKPLPPLQNPRGRRQSAEV